jgi:hypothetical protein
MKRRGFLGALAALLVAPTALNSTSAVPVLPAEEESGLQEPCEGCGAKDAYLYAVEEAPRGGVYGAAYLAEDGGYEAIPAGPVYYEVPLCPRCAAERGMRPS